MTSGCKDLVLTVSYKAVALGLIHYFILRISIVYWVSYTYDCILDNCSSTFIYFYVIPLFLVLIVASHISAFVGVLQIGIRVVVIEN